MTEQDNKGVTILSEDGGEITEAQRREINEAVLWLKNWINKRHEHNFMSDAEYEKAQKKLENLVVATQDNLYFGDANGYYSPFPVYDTTIEGKKYSTQNVIHVRRSNHIGSTVVHEATHALELTDSENACTPEEVQSNYMDDKAEIYARVMETRYKFNLSPEEKLTRENLRYLRDEELGPENVAMEKKWLEKEEEMNETLKEIFGGEVNLPLPPEDEKLKEIFKVSPVKPQTTAPRRSGEPKNILNRHYSEEEKLKFFNDTADNGKKDKEMDSLHTAMAANHSAISDRIAAFRARRNNESIRRADVVASMRADNLRLQQKRRELAEMTGKSLPTSYSRFADRHYSCEDIAARETTLQMRAAETEKTVPAVESAKQTVAKPSALHKFMNFFREEYA